MNDSVKYLRLKRQHLIVPAQQEEYDALFRLMSPCGTVFWTEPGSPPSLTHRAAFDDIDYNFVRRSERKIIKLRFGSVIYVDYRDVELFAAAYMKSRDGLTFQEMELLELLEREGPMNIGMIREITRLKSKEITPVLHKLQEKMIVFEDQADNEGDRSWFLFGDEFPEINLNRYTRLEAIKEILMRFAALMVAFDLNMAKSFYRFSSKDLKAAAAELEAEKRLLKRDGLYIRAEDRAEIESFKEKVPKKVWSMQKNDLLVHCYEAELKKKYAREGCDIREYLMIDGAFCGAVYGYFKFSDVPLEDIVVDKDARAGRDEVIAAVGEVINLELCPLKRYMGKPLN